MMKSMLLVAGMGVAAVFADPKIEMVNLSDLTEKTLESFTQGKLPNTVIVCPAGTVLPLTLSLEGEFLSLESSEEFPAQVKIVKTCLVKCQGETFFFSLDGKNWKEFSEFFTGKLGAAFHTSDQGPFVGLDCELNQKH